MADILSKNVKLDQVLARLKTHRQNHYTVVKDILDKAGEIGDALHGPTVNVSATNALVDQHTALINTQQRNYVQTIADVFGMLSQEQYAALEAVYNAEKAIKESPPVGTTHSR